GQVREAIAGLGDTYRRLQSLATLAIGGGIFGGMIREASQAAEAFSNLQARVRLVTGEGAAFEEAWAGVAQVANSTSTSLEATGTLFARIAQAGKDMGVSQREALALTETINQAVAVSGGGAQAAEAAITQLIQGLQAGVLRGEEFNSVMEQSPRLAKALADGLGVPIGELRKLAQAGELTTETVVRSLRGQSDAVAAEFGKLPPTVGRALQTLSNNWTLYVGEVDKANGISAAAARAITALAGNLDTLGSVLITAGQAAAAFKALQLAQALLGISAAAKAAAAAKAGETAATASKPAATVANTAAKQANVAATVASAAASKGAQAAAASSATRLLGSIGLLARFTGAVGVAAAAAALAYDAVKDSLVGLGTAIGEGVAKLLGWGEVLERNERLLQADAERAREAAVQRARWADETRAAADAALQLGDGARKMVAEFDKLVRGGESAADALGKVTKAMDLGDTRSIQDAIAALDALAARGKITATQMRDALGAALKGIDLGTFRAQATAAFDAGENGARRLQAALQAVADEALRRAGTSARELQTGFSEAMTSAVNDVDALAEALDRVGATGEEAGRLLAGSLDKALDAATTERAVQAVIDRLEELGRQGKLSGEQLAAGLDAARGKLDDIRGGVNSIAEAYKQLGLTSRDELKRIADANRQAWQVIRADATQTLDQKRAAFERYAASAIAANGGVADSTIKAEAQALGLQIQVDKTGKAFVQAFGKAGRAVDDTKQKVDELGHAVNDAGERINQLAGAMSNARAGVRSPTGVRSPGSSAGPTRAGSGIARGQVDNSGPFELWALYESGQLSAEDLGRAQAALKAARTNQQLASTASVTGLGGMADANMWAARMKAVADKAQSLANLSASQAAGTAQATPFGGPAGTQTVRTFDIRLNGQRLGGVNTDAAGQRVLEDLLRRLQDEAGRMGG
ncbi:MAG TPA: tape measure protein, partial [Rubrivivax sp.]|nr:tape measure protein [Rubrivivax sp.]